MLLTFKDFKAGPARRCTGVGSGTRDFRDYLNDATRQLMRRGNWWGTVQPMRGCVYDGCVVWPRQVAAVLAMNVCDRAVGLANHWFRFLPWDNGWNAACSRLGYGYRANGIADSDGTLPVFRQIPDGYNLFVMFFIENPNDVGKTVTLYGVDINGQTIRTKRPDGTVQDGVVLTLASPHVITPFAIRRVDRILKDVTQGNVRAYMSDANGVLMDMGFYQPSETSPDYVRTRIPQWRRGCGVTEFTALVKLAFIPVKHDDDQVLIENEDALVNMILSIRNKEQQNVTAAMQFETLAFRELNYEMRTRFPDEQFNMNFKPFGRDTLARQRIGRMI
jgi:hypothetical protein